MLALRVIVLILTHQMRESDVRTAYLENGKKDFLNLTHLGLVSHICVMKNSPHFPSDAYTRRKSLYFSYRSRGRPTKQCQAKMSFKGYSGGEHKKLKCLGGNMSSIVTINMCLLDKETLVFIVNSMELTHLFIHNIFAKKEMDQHVVNPRSQTHQGKPVSKPETPLHNSLVVNVNEILRSSIITSSIWYSQRKSEGRDIIGIV